MESVEINQLDLRWIQSLVGIEVLLDYQFVRSIDFMLFLRYFQILSVWCLCVLEYLLLVSETRYLISKWTHLLTGHFFHQRRVSIWRRLRLDYRFQRYQNDLHELPVSHQQVGTWEIRLVGPHFSLRSNFVTRESGLITCKVFPILVSSF